MKLRSVIVSGLSASMTVGLVGCATTMKNMNSFERKASVCVGTVAAGAIFGALIAGKKGAAIGGGAGGLACVLFAALDPYDKDRIRSTQKRSVNEERALSDSWQGKDGKRRSLMVSTPETVQMPSQPGRICRRINSEVQVEGRGSQKGEDIFCRTPDGDWVPA